MKKRKLLRLQSCIINQIIVNKRLVRNWNFLDQQFPDLLANVNEKGYVHIEIKDSFSNLSDLEEQLKNKYHLKGMHVVYSSESDYDQVTKYLSNFVAEYTGNIITDNTILDVSWELQYMKL